jgi:uncharacterized damage-inducible protein DinB
MNDSDRDILNHFTYTRAKTLEVLHGITDEMLPRVPDADSQTVAQQFYYISRSTEWFMDTVMGDGGGEVQSIPVDRNELVQLLEVSAHRPSAFFETNPARWNEQFTATIGGGTVETHSGRIWLLTTIDHEVHHRGRILLALRQMGVGGFPVFLYT